MEQRLTCRPPRSHIMASRVIRTAFIRNNNILFKDLYFSLWLLLYCVSIKLRSVTKKMDCQFLTGFKLNS